MSPDVERSDQPSAVDLESGLEALRQSSEFRGPVEPPDDHEHPKDHLALIYESQEEQFATVIPFIRQGLEQGERCLYVVDENSREEVLEAMRTRGINVDAALNSGALTVHTKQDTYLKNGEFDPDEMVAYLNDTISEALEEYEGFRAIGEMTWILDDEPRVEDFMEYESKLTSLYSRENTIGLCQYNRERFPPGIIRDIISTHPHLIHNNVVSQNVYYTPPEEFLGPNQPAREVDRMLGTLQERTEAKTEVADHKRFLQDLNEITANPNRSFEEKLHDLFDLGCEWFDLSLGALNRVDPDSDRLEVEHISGGHEYYKPGAEFPLSETYCIAAADIKEAASVSDPPEEGFDDIAVYEEFGVESYLGTYLPVDGGEDRTFAFIAAEPRTEPFSKEDRTYIKLMGQWVKYELERQQYQQDLEETIHQLQQSNNRLKQFAYAASHDLQEPLRMVSSYLQLLEDRYRADLDEEAQEFIDFAVDGADRMREMVGDLLAYSKVEQSTGEFKSVDFDTVLERAMDGLQVQIEEHDAEITAESLPTVAADSEQVEQLFRNLVSNAIKYSGDDPPQIEIAATQRSDHWEFAVSDNGIGIDPEKTDRIFEVFTRLHHDDEVSGTGIGLSLCQEIVDNHGGDIWVESEPGEGSTFYFTLPGADAE